MNEKQRKKEVKRLKKQIIPKIKARNLAIQPEKNLELQGVYEAKAIFTNFDYGTGKALGEKIQKFREAWNTEGRTDHTVGLGNDIKSYIIEKTEEMAIYRISHNNTLVPANKISKFWEKIYFYLTGHKALASIIKIIGLIAALIAIFTFF